MIIESDYTRTISRQSGCDFHARVSQCDFNSVIRIGLSGDQTLGFTISGGRVYDNESNFVDSLSLPLDLRYAVSNSVAGAYVNNNLLSYSTGDYSFDYIYVNNTGDLNISLDLAGDRPELNYSGINDFDEGIDVITGVLLSDTPDRVYRIMSGEIIKNSVAQVSLSGWTTGDISSSGFLYFSSEEDSYLRTGIVEVALYTNFGRVDFSLDVLSNSTNESDYISIAPNSDLLFPMGTMKSFRFDSYFSFGSRDLDVYLEKYSGHLGLTGQPVDITGVWSMSTGQYFPIIYDFADNGWFASGRLENISGECPLRQNFINKLYSEVHYDGSGTSGVNIAKLYITDGVINDYILISGTGQIP